MSSKLLRSVAVFCSVLTIATVASSTNVVKALLINTSTPNFVLDTFDTLSYAPDPSKNQDYWWVTLGSSLYPRGENVPCANGTNGDSTCAIIQREGWNKYVRLRLKPGQPSGEFSLAQLTEERDAYNYNTPHRWLPRVGHPVVLTARVRFSPNYKADASGTAVGTAGIDFWNAPTEVTTEPPYLIMHPAKAINISWQDSDNFYGMLSGFRVTVVDQENPAFIVYNQPVTGVNINEWFVETIIWSVDANGVQSVKFMINGRAVGETTLPTAFPALTVDMWADNNNFTGDIQSSTPSLITEEHYQDIDFVTVFQY